MLTTCFVYCGPFFLVFCINNTVAWIYGVRCLSLLPFSSTTGTVHPAGIAWELTLGRA